MNNPFPLIAGDLVKTADDYFAIILFFNGNEVGLFLCNGMATVVNAEELEPVTIHEGPSHANFKEILADNWQAPDAPKELRRWQTNGHPRN